MLSGKKDNLFRSVSNFFLTICMHALALWIAFGDAIVEFAASYIKVLDEIKFDDFDDFCDCKDSGLELGTFRRDILNTHNLCRSLHGCPPLTMSEKLTCSAQTWANKLAHRRMLLYSEKPGIGENISLLDLDESSFHKKGQQVTREWYSELDNYDFKDPGWKRDCFRATQLLWKESSEMGVGLAKIPDENRAYVVVHYKPPGNSNMPEAFKRNILPLRSQKELLPEMTT